MEAEDRFAMKTAKELAEVFLKYLDVMEEKDSTVLANAMIDKFPSDVWSVFNDALYSRKNGGNLRIQMEMILPKDEYADVLDVLDIMAEKHYKAEQKATKTEAMFEMILKNIKEGLSEK